MQNLLFILCFLLISCSTFYNINDDNIIKYNQPIKLESSFLINGRFFIKSSNSYYGNFTWMHNKLEDNIEFKSPIGQVFTKLNINNKTKLSNLIIKQKIYESDDIENIMQQNLGFYLPFQYLYFWVCGANVPNYPVDKYFYNGFKQFNFEVYFLSWYDINHPKVIKIMNDNTVIKLFLTWN